jgi:hypothetical protein
MKSVLHLLTGATLVSAVAMGCLDTPAEQVVPARKLIERTKTIVLAQVAKAEMSDDAGGIRYTFKVEKILKGSPAESFTMNGAVTENPEDVVTFDHHTSEEFWTDHGGRSVHDADCQIHPRFSVGVSYLVFLDPPYHRKSFEQITRTHGGPGVRDKWLSWVEEQASGDPAPSSDGDKPAK